MGKSNFYGRQGLRLLALAGGILVASATAHAVPVFDRMVLFGDSLSDTGNTRNVVGAASGLIANLAGYGSNGRFSNGNLWHETLAPLIGVPVNTASRVAGPNNVVEPQTVAGGAAVVQMLRAMAAVLDQLRQPGNATAFLGLPSHPLLPAARGGQLPLKVVQMAPGGNVSGLQLQAVQQIPASTCSD